MTCQMEIEIFTSAGFSGSGKSTTSGQQAKEQAWSEACARIRTAQGLDCHDREHVAVGSEASRTFQTTDASGTIERRYEHEVTVGVMERAVGFGDAVDDRRAACRRAKQHACEQIVHGPCPGVGVRVVSVDGKPPRPATVEPPPNAGTVPRPTI